MRASVSIVFRSLLLAAPTWLLADLLSAGPALRFTEVEHDFGKVASGRVLKAEFEFTNTGDEPLEILGVRPGCGCTTTGEWTKRVEPGKKGVIPLGFNSAGLEGPFAKAVTVITNDKEHAQMSLTLRGLAWKAFEVLPGSLVFNFVEDMPAGGKQIVRIVNRTDKPVSFSAPRCELRGYEMALKTIKDGQEYELAVNLAENEHPVAGSGHVVLNSSSKEDGEFAVQIISAMTPAVAASPNPYFLPMGVTTIHQPLRVALRNNGKEPVKITEAFVSDPKVRVKLDELDPGRFYSLEAVFPDGYVVEAEHPVKLSVRTTHPKYPVIEVPVLPLPVQPGRVAHQNPAQPAQPLAPQPVGPMPRSSETPVADSGAVRPEFEKTLVDLGEIEAAGSHTATFKFTNPRDGVAEIVAVRPLLGIGRATAWTPKVAKGEKGSVEVVVDTALLQGEVEAAFAVVCKTSPTPVEQIRVKAVVKRSVIANPPSLAISLPADVNESAPVVTRLTVPGDKPLLLSDPLCVDPAFVVSLKTVKDGREYELSVVAKLPDDRPVASSRVTLKTDSVKVPSVGVDVFASRKPSVVAAPGVILLPVGTLGKATERELVVRAVGKAELGEVAAECADPAVKIHVGKPGKGDVRVKMTFPAGYEVNPARRAEIIVSAGGGKSLRVPIVPQAAPPAPSIQSGPPKAL